MDENAKIELFATQTRYCYDLILKNYVKFLEVLYEERFQDSKVTRDLELDRERKIRRLNTMSHIILNKNSMSDLDFQCIKKFIDNQEFIFNNASEIATIQSEKCEKNKCLKVF